jgi:hypothetical protein
MENLFEREEKLGYNRIQNQSSCNLINLHLLLIKAIKFVNFKTKERTRGKIKWESYNGNQVTSKIVSTKRPNRNKTDSC